MSEKKTAGQPPKEEGEKQTTFTVNCKKKNLEAIKPLAKSYVKELDKKDWSKENEKFYCWHADATVDLVGQCSEQCDECKATKFTDNKQ